MRLVRKIFYVFVLMTAIAYAKDDPNTNDQSSQVYTEDKQNILISKDNPDFTIKLKSNPTTGYAWFLREYDIDLLLATKHKFEKSATQAIGAPGYEFWSFHVKPIAFVVPHQTTIRLIYTRPWTNADNSTQLVFRVTTSTTSTPPPASNTSKPN